MKLKQTRNISALIHIYALGRGDGRQTRHPHDVSGHSYGESGPRGENDLSDFKSKIPWSSPFSGIVGEGFRGFGDADGQGAKSDLCDSLDLLFSLGGVFDAFSAINFCRDCLVPRSLTY